MTFPRRGGLEKWVGVLNGILKMTLKGAHEITRMLISDSRSIKSTFATLKLYLYTQPTFQGIPVYGQLDCFCTTWFPCLKALFFEEIAFSWKTISGYKRGTQHELKPLIFFISNNILKFKNIYLVMYLLLIYYTISNPFHLCARECYRLALKT